MHRVSDLWEAFKYSFVISAGIAAAGALVAGGVKSFKKGVLSLSNDEESEAPKEVVSPEVEES